MNFAFSLQPLLKHFKVSFREKRYNSSTTQAELKTLVSRMELAKFLKTTVLKFNHWPFGKTQ